MTEAWERRGTLFVPAAQRPWLKSHAALPCALPLPDGRHRVFFSPRNADGRSVVASCSVDLRSEAPTAGELSHEPLLEPGRLGAFDDSGCSVSCVVAQSDRLWLFYTGWSLGVRTPFVLQIGLALSDDGGLSFRRHSEAPLLGRHPVDPFLTASPWILVEEGLWRMWYVSGVDWTLGDGEVPKHRYHIRYAESDDGLEWRREGRVCLDFAGDEHAFGRPCVVRDGDRYRMWFCVRGDAYRLGVAESADGLTWERRDDELELTPPPQGWDGSMQAYPTVFRHEERWHMIYNGDGYGRTGFGLAVQR